MNLMNLMNLNKRTVPRLVAVAGFAAAASSFAATPEDPMGRPAGYQGVDKPAVDTTGIDYDAFGGAPQQGIVPMQLPDTLTMPAGTYEDQGPLEHPAWVQVEFEAEPTKHQESLAAALDAAWQAGEYDLGRELIEQLRATGFDGGIGYSYIYDDQQPASKFFDVFAGERRIGGTRTGAVMYEMDFAPDGTIYAVVLWGFSTWTLNRSTDGGNSWTETFSWTGPLLDVDIAVVGGHVYVGYLATTGRLRRASAATGLSDGAFGFQIIITGTGGELPLRDVAVEGNADSFDNRIYFGMLKSDGTIFFSWDDSSDGTNPTEASPAVANAVPPLDMAWNADFTAYGVFMSYMTASNDVGVARTDGVNWPLTTVTNTTTTRPDVSVSAYQDTIIVAYEDSSNEPMYHITYDGGDTYVFSGAFFAAGPNYTRNDVAASLGYGTAMVAGAEVGEPDILRSVHRPNYVPGPWPNSVDSNQIDVRTGSKVAIEALPAFNGGAYSYGVIHSTNDDIPYFDRIDEISSCPGDIADDFGTLGGDGMVSFGDFLALLGLVGPCPGGIPGCVGDIADDFGTLNGGDGMVSFGDFLALLGLVGPCP